MNKFVISLFFILFASNAFVQTKESDPLSKSLRPAQKDILKKLKSAGQLSFSDFIDKMKEISSLFTKYIENEKIKCSSSFVVYEFLDNNQKKTKKRKLNSKEKKMCEYILVNFQIRYVKESFKQRKKQLQIMQKDQLSELEKLENAQLKLLDNLLQEFK